MYIIILSFISTVLFSPISVFIVCKEFRLIYRDSTPTCDPFAYDEGAWSSTGIAAYADMSVCFRRCLDMPECLSVGFWLGPNCTYHDCISPGPLSAGAWAMVYKDCFRGQILSLCYC